MDTPDSSPPLSDAELLQHGYRYALALAHRPEEAEDLVHDAWLNLSRRYGRVESKAILFTTIRNLFIDQCRRRKIVGFESLDQPEPPVLPLAPAEEPGIQGDLRALLGLLRPAERELLFLHYYEGRTAEEIGRTLGQPRGTVLSSIHRAVARLRAAAEAAAPGQPLSPETLVLLVILLLSARP